MPKIRLDGIEYPVTPEAENVFSRYLAEANRYAEIGNLPVSSARKFESRLAGLIGQTVFETNGTEATKIIAKLGSVESVYSDILGNGPGERLTGEFAETPERNFDSGLPGKGTRELSESSGLPRKGTGEFAEILGAPLVRDGKNGILFGVAAGIGKRWDIDPIYVRLAFLVGSFFYVGFFAYVALIFLMEKDPSAAAPADLWLSRADGFASKTNRNGAVPANGGAFQGSGSFAAPTVSAFAQNANPFDAMPRAAGGEAWGFFRMIQKLFSIGISAIVLFTFVPLAVFLVFASMLTSSGYEMYNQVIFWNVHPAFPASLAIAGTVLFLLAGAIILRLFGMKTVENWGFAAGFALLGISVAGGIFGALQTYSHYEIRDKGEIRQEIRPFAGELRVQMAEFQRDYSVPAPNAVTIRLSPSDDGTSSVRIVSSVSGKDKSDTARILSKLAPVEISQSGSLVRIGDATAKFGEKVNFPFVTREIVVEIPKDVPVRFEDLPTEIQLTGIGFSRNWTYSRNCQGSTVSYDRQSMAYSCDPILASDAPKPGGTGNGIRDIADFPVVSPVSDAGSESWFPTSE